MAKELNYDAKKFPVCAPWDGARGPSWVRVFKVNFENGLRTQTDNFSSLHEFLVTETDYGGVNGPAHPGGAGMAAIAFQSQAARTNRIAKTYGYILNHITNQDIKDTIEAEVAAMAAAGPLPANWVSVIWRWIDANLGQPNATGLLTLNQNDAWTKTKLNDVGIHRETLRSFHAHLLRLNRERQAPFPPMDIWVKFLKEITFPTMLANEAIKQLQRPTYLVPAGLPNAGQPDLNALLTDFEEIWHQKYDAGIEIKPQSAPRPNPHSGNTADGMSVQVCQEADQLDAFAARPFGKANGTPPYSATTTSFVRRERNCWNCRGWGHEKQDCPSVVSQRPIQECIAGLTEIMSNTSPTRRRIVKARGMSPRPRGTPPTGPNTRAYLASTDEEILIQYEDGGIFTEDGDMVTAPLPEPEPDKVDTNQASAATTVVDTTHKADTAQASMATTASEQEGRASQPPSRGLMLRVIII